MKPQNETEKIEKEALNLFVLVASVVFTAALTFCLLTHHETEMEAVFGGTAIIAFLTINTYKSFNNS